MKINAEISKITVNTRENSMDMAPRNKIFTSMTFVLEMVLVRIVVIVPLSNSLLMLNAPKIVKMKGTKGYRKLNTREIRRNPLSTDFP